MTIIIIFIMQVFNFFFILFPYLPQTTVQSQGDASASKKGKLDPPTVEGIEVRFDWEGDKSKWVCFSKKFNRELTSAYNSGENQVCVSSHTVMKNKNPPV